MNDDERRQTRAFSAETVRDPGTRGRESDADLSGLHLVVGLNVIVRSAVHRVDERDVVDVLSGFREHLGHQLARLSHPLELEGARHQRTRVALTHMDITNAALVERLARIFHQPLFVVPEIDGARPAGHEERDHRLGARLEVRRLDRIRIGPERRRRARIRRCGRCQQSLLIQQIRESEAADAAARPEQKLATRPEISFVVMMHSVTSCREIRSGSAARV